MIRRYASDPDLAKDIYQEVFLNVYRNIGTFAFKSDFYTWVYRITVNTALGIIKKENKHRADNLERAEAVGKYDKDQLYIQEIISEAQKLPPKQRMVFFMRFQNDLKISEIASSLNIDEGTVKGYLFRSIKRIRQSLVV